MEWIMHPEIMIWYISGKVSPASAYAYVATFFFSVFNDETVISNIIASVDGGWRCRLICPNFIFIFFSRVRLYVNIRSCIWVYTYCHHFLCPIQCIRWMKWNENYVQTIRETRNLWALFAYGQYTPTLLHSLSSIELFPDCERLLHRRNVTWTRSPLM